MDASIVLILSVVGCKPLIRREGNISCGVLIARFPFVDWTELLEACHSMSNPNSPQEKSVKKNAHGLLRIIVRLKMPSKRYRSAQMTRHFIQALVVEIT